MRVDRSHFRTPSLALSALSVNRYDNGQLLDITVAVRLALQDWYQYGNNYVRCFMLLRSTWVSYRRPNVSKNGANEVGKPDDRGRRRSGRTIGNDVSGLMLDLGVPAAARRRRVTLANVSAVCEQLGEHVSTRNVQRVLGGSLRDIGPLVRAWKKNRAEPAATDADGGHDLALGAILRGALQEHGAAVAAALEKQARSNEAAHRALLVRVESLVRGRDRNLAKAGTGCSGQDRTHAEVADPTELRRELKELQAGLSRLEKRGAVITGLASTQDIVALSSRIDGLAKAINHLQLTQLAPVRPDEMLLAPVIARLDALGVHLSAGKNLEHTATASLLSSLARIETQMAALAPTPRTQPSKAVLSRLDALLAEIAALPGRMERAPKPAARRPAAKHAGSKAPAKKSAAKEVATKKAIKRRASAKKVATRKAAAKKAVATKNPTTKTAMKAAKPRARGRKAPAAVAKKRPTSAVTKRLRQSKRQTTSATVRQTNTRKQGGATRREAHARSLVAKSSTPRLPAVGPLKARVTASGKRVASTTKRKTAATWIKHKTRG